MRHWALAAGAVLCASCAGVAIAAARAEARERSALRSPLFTSPVQVSPVRQLTLDLSREEVRLAARPTLRIGDDVSGPEFGRISDVAPSRSGDTVYVLDAMEARVSAFDRGGRFLFGFGGRGSGPGEFRRPAALLVLPWSGDVGVWDPEAQRLTLHSPDGAQPRTVDPSPGRRLTSSRTVRRLAAYRDGFVVEVHEDPLVVGPERQHALLVRLDRDFGARDTLARVAIPGTTAFHVEAAVGSSATTWLNPPVYSPVLSWDLLADGSVLLAPGGPPDVYRLEAQGATRMRWRHRPERLTRRDRLRRLEGEIETGLFRAPPVPVTALEPLHRQFFSTLRPAFTGVLAGPAGDVWVRHFDTRDSWEGHSLTWERVARDGTPRPVIRMPEGFRPQRIIGSQVYGVAVDPLGVERVEVYLLDEDVQKR
jgi:hypothetical protein